MRRTDRLFDLIQILRDGRLHTARDMAGTLEVSVRTIWRDMATLMAAGLPVEGERGVGYVLRAPITLPPLTLTPDEAEALSLGLRLVSEGADPGLARAAGSLRGKIEAVSPARAALPDAGLWVFPGAEAALAAPHLPLFRKAIRDRQRLRVVYRTAEGIESKRCLRPLQLEFWGRVWTLAAFCETRGEFRSFRLDRLLRVEAEGTAFPREAGRELEDYRAQIAAGLTLSG